MSHDQPACPLSVAPNLSTDTMAGETMDGAEPNADENKGLELSDEQFLSIVRDQRRLATGMEADYQLSADREQALLYFKGQMPDLPSMKNRSKAVSTDIAEAVETVLPDLMEIFTGGDDVATFTPRNEQDETGAQQETEYVQYVVFQQNPGFLSFYSAIKDALIEKIGLWTWWWEDKLEEYDEKFEGISAIQLQLVIQAAEQDGLDIVSVEQEPSQTPMLPTFSVTVHRSANKGRLRIQEVSPDDFTVAMDTTARLQDTTYCAMRTRPRIQDLIAEGYDRELVENLPPYGGASLSENVERARDTAGEHNNSPYPPAYEHSDLRAVEVMTHYIRVDADDDGQPELWKVVTGNEDRVFLAKEKVNRIPFAAITPMLTPHRFHGRSLADVLIEIQRIKTTLLRMLLDQGYFALNQRMEVAMGSGRANQFTISDLLNNIPGAPIRSADGNSVRPIQNAGLGFDVMAAMEYTSVLGEQRSGVVRNAQGLNPDTLHDTKGGMLALMSNAQRRVRLIARVLAETGVKDLYLGVHATLREHATQAETVRLRGQWVNIDPTQWGEREDMEIEVGVGSGGADQDIASMNALAAIMEKVIELQGGQTNGPFVTAPDLYKLLSKYPGKLRLKGQYFTDPAQAPPQAPKPPDPKAQADQGKLQLDQQRVQLEQQEFQREQARKDQDQQFEQQYKLKQLDQERELKIAELNARYQTSTDTARISAGAKALNTQADMVENAAERGHNLVQATVEAGHAERLMDRQAMHDHVGAIRDAALNVVTTPAPDPVLGSRPQASDEPQQ